MGGPGHLFPGAHKSKKYDKKGKLQELESFDKGKRKSNNISLGIELTEVKLENGFYAKGILVKNKKNDPQALYNLDKDREETTNLIEMDKDRLKDMQFKWNEWSADLIDCIF